MTMQVSSGAVAGWLLISAGLVGVIALQLDGRFPFSPSTAVTAAPNSPMEHGTDSRDDLAINLPSPEILDEIVDRPLFSSSRRPFLLIRNEAPNAAPAKKTTLSLTLAGTMLAGEARMALLLHPTKGLLRLRQGQKIDGWRIGDIGEDEVSLKRGGRTALLRLRENPLESEISKVRATSIGKAANSELASKPMPAE